MSKTENDPDIIEHLGEGSRLRVVKHPDEGHIRPDPELEALLRELARRRLTAYKRADDADSGAPDSTSEGKQEMKQAVSPTPQTQLTKDKLPQCKQCDKPVEHLTVSPHPTDEGQIIIEFNCHGETVSQEVSASLLKGKAGLARYKVFNSMTSGMMPRHEHTQGTAKKAGKK